MNDEGNFHEVEQQVPIHEQSLSHGAGKGILARCMGYLPGRIAVRTARTPPSNLRKYADKTKILGKQVARERSFGEQESEMDRGSQKGWGSKKDRLELAVCLIC